MSESVAIKIPREVLREILAEVDPASFRRFQAEGSPPLESVKASYITHVVELCNGDLGWAARVLGVSKGTVKKYRKVAP
jgi:hypothetical protein